jgi:hypothetical protein
VPPVKAPSITGTPATTATAGQAYSFQPQGSGGDGAALSYTIANKPSWATFTASTGKLSGTPAATDVGSDKGVEISVTDGTNVTSLAAFNITVSPAAATAAVTLSWSAPTENTDGTALSNLQGYNVHYGTSSGTYTQTIKVANAGVTTYVVQSLPAGTYYFAVSAYNSAGADSGLSPEVSTTVQ